MHTLITHGITALVFFAGGWWAAGKYRAKLKAKFAALLTKPPA